MNINVLELTQIIIISIMLFYNELHSLLIVSIKSNQIIEIRVGAPTLYMYNTTGTLNICPTLRYNYKTSYNLGYRRL